MKKTLFKNKIPLLLLLSFFSIKGTAQDIGWQWANAGGGNVGSTSESTGAYRFTSERILDIKTDADNNYYYLAKITQGNPHIGGTIVETYNNPTAGTGSFEDVALFSTNADGNLRWHRIIGGGKKDVAYSIVLDNENGVYVAPVTSFALVDLFGGEGETPPHFSEDNSLPQVDGTATGNQTDQEGFKTGFLLRYNTNNGDLVWRKDLQGDVNFYNRYSFIHQLIIDSSNTIHMVVGLTEGTHLDGQVTVPLTEPVEYSYYLVKFDTSGNITQPPTLLPFDGGFVEGKFVLRYDEDLNRYYFAGGKTNHGSVGTFTDLSYNGVPFTHDGYILAIDAETFVEQWRKEITALNSNSDRCIYGLEIDQNSDIYIGGRFVNSPVTPGVSIGGYTLNTELAGNIPFILKMNSSGDILWHKVPDGYTNSLGTTVTQYAYDVAINGNEVALATESAYHIWGNFQVGRPQSHGTDPVLVRFNKQTGAVVGLNDIMGSPGGNDALTAVTVDNEGAYLVGGYIRGGLFTDNPNDVATIYNAQGQNNSYTDFFYAKLTVDTSAGTKDYNTINVNVYPNPTTNILNIETTENLSDYTVYDNLGRKVQNGLFGSDNQINLQSQATGIYFIKINTVQGNTATVKVVKK